MEGIVGIRQPHFWQHSSDMIIGTIHVQALPEASEQKIIQEVYCSYNVIERSSIWVSSKSLSIGYTNENNMMKLKSD
jgi:Co/Zn/Cd efflux system component